MPDTQNPIVDHVLEAQKAKGVTLAELGEQLGRNPVWVAAAMRRQASMDEEDATRLGKALDLDSDIVEVLQEPPMKGSLSDTVPADPLVYRFHEIMQVYGTAVKAVIHEEFGDGIMSAIDFQLDVSRKPDPNGDHVVVTMDGKFLPYRKW